MHKYKQAKTLKWPCYNRCNTNQGKNFKTFQLWLFYNLYNCNIAQWQWREEVSWKSKLDTFFLGHFNVFHNFSLKGYSKMFRHVYIYIFLGGSSISFKSRFKRKWRVKKVKNYSSSHIYSAVPTLSLRLCFKRVFSSSLSYELLFSFQGPD